MPNEWDIGDTGVINSDGSVTFGPYNVPTYNPRTPQIIVTPQGGITNYSDKLSTVLNSILSGIALLKGARQVPTTVSADDGGGYGGGGMNPQILALLQAQSLNRSDGTASGKVELWLKNNTGVAIMAAVGIGLYLMKSPRK